MLFRSVVVRFGEILPLPALSLSDDSLQNVREAAGLLAEKINGLLERK